MAIFDISIVRGHLNSFHENQVVYSLFCIRLGGGGGMLTTLAQYIKLFDFAKSISKTFAIYLSFLMISTC